MTSDPASTARRALHRGDPASLGLFDKAIESDPGNAQLWLGKARALELNGDTRGARIVARQLAEQAPGFLEAQAFLAELRLAAGEADFASQDAQTPREMHPAFFGSFDWHSCVHSWWTLLTLRRLYPDMPEAAQIETLAGLDYPAQAAEIAAVARSRFPQEPHFALLEAIYAGASGQWDRAEAIYAGLDNFPPQRALHEARHRLRARDWKAANALLGRALRDEPWDIAAWALQEIAWRLAGDARADWLHQQSGLVQLRPLQAREGLVQAAAEQLRVLHRSASMPLGQSLRGGTQTRGLLFDRPEPVLAELHRSIRAALEQYRAELPARDAAHPLLRHRDANWRISASWSVRLSGGGDHHAAHIHPGGIVSSALYLAVPAQAKDARARQGWLELGRPPRDLGLDLAPLVSIEPKEGHLALFPSTVFHGTTAFGVQGAGGRLSDAVAGAKTCAARTVEPAHPHCPLAIDLGLEAADRALADDDRVACTIAPAANRLFGLHPARAILQLKLVQAVAHNSCPGKHGGELVNILIAVATAEQADLGEGETEQAAFRLLHLLAFGNDQFARFLRLVNSADFAVKTGQARLGVFNRPAFEQPVDHLGIFQLVDHSFLGGGGDWSEGNRHYGNGNQGVCGTHRRDPSNGKCGVAAIRLVPVC